MHQIRLREASVPAQTGTPVWETTVGALLRERFLAGELEAG